MHVREARASDIAEMHRIRLSVRENALTDRISVQPQHYEVMLKVRGRGWVAEIDGQIVGFAVADAIAGTVWALFVDQSSERRGVGRELHDTMIRWFFDQGIDSVRLSTMPGTRAERFYKAAGWRYLRHNPEGEVCYELPRESWRAGAARRSRS